MQLGCHCPVRQTVPNLHGLSFPLSLQASGAAALQQWQARLSYYVYETVGSLRIGDMFDIVVDYPDRWGGCVGRWGAGEEGTGTDSLQQQHSCLKLSTMICCRCRSSS